ncbi:hypothetical protein F5B19DRAFT_493984 [Rostrohypoxylon terebratum]|nr:hypothetical protein F5B19DRAFT_493984 [Rostrohypoxylon terebratum]
MTEQQRPPFIVVSPPDLLALPIRTRRMAEQQAASTDAPASEQTNGGSGSGNDDGSASDKSGHTSTSTASTTTVRTAGQESGTMCPPPPRLRDNMDFDFDPPFPDTDPDPSTYLPYVSPGQSPSSTTLYPSSPMQHGSFTQQLQGYGQENNPFYSAVTTPFDADADADADADDGEADAEVDPIPYPDQYPEASGIWDTIPCPCPCHEDTAARLGRPRLAFTNAAYLVCPACWIDAWMTAHGSQTRPDDCEVYLRAQGKDPMIPASQQC